MDSKYVMTGGQKHFAMEEAEIHKYQILREYAKEKWEISAVDVIFLVLPAERKGTEMLWIPLDELVDCAQITSDGKAGRRISLIGRPVHDIPPLHE